MRWGSGLWMFVMHSFCVIVGMTVTRTVCVHMVVLMRLIMIMIMGMCMLMTVRMRMSTVYLHLTLTAAASYAHVIFPSGVHPSILLALAILVSADAQVCHRRLLNL
jgi:hypothetical protein